jgi:hypothetical protein
VLGLALNTSYQPLINLLYTSCTKLARQNK